MVLIKQQKEFLFMGVPGVGECDNPTILIHFKVFLLFSKSGLKKLIYWHARYHQSLSTLTAYL